MQSSVILKQCITVNSNHLQPAYVARRDYKLHRLIIQLRMCDGFFRTRFRKSAPGHVTSYVDVARGRSATKSNQCADYNMIGTGVVYKVVTEKMPTNSKAGFSNKEECMTRIRYWLKRKRLFEFAKCYQTSKENCNIKTNIQ